MPKWVEANGGFFETFKKIAFNEGGGKRATQKAYRNEHRRSGERVAQNLKEGENLRTVLRQTRKDAGTSAKKFKTGDADANAEYAMDAAYRNLRADGKTMGENATREDVDKAVRVTLGRIKRGSKVEAAKGYWSEPYNNLTSKDENIRSLAKAQLVGRTAMVAGGATLGVGMTHDLFSSRENDTGLGGVVGNTMAMTTLGAAGAGISLLKKL